MFGQNSNVLYTASRINFSLKNRLRMCDLFTVINGSMSVHFPHSHYCGQTDSMSCCNPADCCVVAVDAVAAADDVAVGAAAGMLYCLDYFAAHALAHGWHMSVTAAAAVDSDLTLPIHWRTKTGAAACAAETERLDVVAVDTVGAAFAAAGATALEKLQHQQLANHQGDHGSHYFVMARIGPGTATSIAACLLDLAQSIPKRQSAVAAMECDSADCAIVVGDYGATTIVPVAGVEN